MVGRARTEVSVWRSVSLWPTRLARIYFRRSDAATWSSSTSFARSSVWSSADRRSADGPRRRAGSVLATATAWWECEGAKFDIGTLYKYRPPSGSVSHVRLSATVRHWIGWCSPARADRVIAPICASRRCTSHRTPRRAATSADARDPRQSTAEPTMTLGNAGKRIADDEANAAAQAISFEFHGISLFDRI